MREILNVSDLSRNLGVSGNYIHIDLLNTAVKQTGETKSKLVQRLIVKHLENEVKLIRTKKNEEHFKQCLDQRGKVK